jgi:hypothetical protein
MVAFPTGMVRWFGLLWYCSYCYSVADREINNKAINQRRSRLFARDRLETCYGPSQNYFRTAVGKTTA